MQVLTPVVTTANANACTTAVVLKTDMHRLVHICHPVPQEKQRLGPGRIGKAAVGEPRKVVVDAVQHTVAATF